MTHVEKGGGLDLIVLDYPTPAKLSNTVLLKWKEVNSVQIFTQQHCGDSYPKVQLSRLRSEPAYCDEIAHNFEIVKDDILATTELALAYKKQKTRILNQQIIDLRKKAVGGSESVPDKDILASFFTAIKEEVDGSRLQHFSYVVDSIYQREFYNHYTNFKSLDCLLDP
jgi:hypothetical protein